MDLCIVRHAIAEERGGGVSADRERPLTDRGKQRMREAAAGLQQLFQPQAVVSSPLRRAVETAAILQDAYGLRRMEVHNSLATGDDEELLDYLARLKRERVAIVGHEPHVSETLSYLLTGRPERVRSQWRKGAAALLCCPGEPAAGKFALMWLLQPMALRAVGRGKSDDGDHEGSL